MMLVFSSLLVSPQPTNFLSILMLYMLMKKEKTWHEILGHLNVGKSYLLSTMIHGLHLVYSTKGVYEGCAINMHHKEKLKNHKS